MMCIYKIENTINNKSYVGLTTNYKIRKTKHLYLLRHNKHENQHLQKAWNKHGESSFVFEILEIKDKLKNYKRGLYTKLGKEYGVHPTTISLIHTNKVWKNL